MHTIHSRIVEPTQNLISIDLIGCGGTGSLLLPIIARFAYALKDARQLDIHVNVYDDDEVDIVNPCRQGFSKFETGLNKAVAYLNRLNMFWDYSWNACMERYPNPSVKHPSKIIISATDNKKSRYEIERFIKRNNRKNKENNESHVYYWLDIGNTRDTGNIILTDLKNLPSVTQYYTDDVEDVSVPSCSIAQSLESQNILINQYMATLGAQMLWDLLNNKELDYSGMFVNAKTLKINKIKINDGNTKAKTKRVIR